jgi:hypothetical protein
MKTLRLQVHQANVARYEGLLACDLTPYERRYLEQMLEQERSAIRWMFSGRSDRGASHSTTSGHAEACDEPRLVPPTNHANPPSR